MRDIRESIIGIRGDVSIALLDARRKLHPYMGHRMRCTVQENRLVSLFRKVMEYPQVSMSVMSFDYRMKLRRSSFKRSEQNSSESKVCRVT